MTKTMPQKGDNYNHTYGNYIEFFKNLQPGDVCEGVPVSWVPLILYLGGRTMHTVKMFPQDDWCKSGPELEYEASKHEKKPVALRHWVEFHCALRPELTDALWKSDMQWNKTAGRDLIQKARGIVDVGEEHLITNYNAFYRPQLVEFRDRVLEYKSGLKKAVLTNCFADKPYPHEVHKKIQAIYPHHELLITTGVLGVVPSFMFPGMPPYDSGIPNFWMVKDIATQFFRNNQYEEIHVFTDFYQQAIVPVIINVLPKCKVTFEFPYQPMKDYLLDENYEFTLRR